MNEMMKKAELARIKIELRALELEVVCSRPVTECGGRYDCLIDWKGKIYRAQIKYADGFGSKLSGGKISLHLSKPKGRGVSRPYTEDEIDVVLVYMPKLDQVLWIGPELFNGKHILTIRYEPSKSGRKEGCHMAQDLIWR